MPTTFVPEGFQYVVASLLATGFLLQGQASVVGKYRKKAGIKYPQLYAEKAEADASKDAALFNCAQRAHHNTLENMPIVIITTLISGLRYPHIAASFCAAFVVGRVAYTRGYLTGDPSKRYAQGGVLNAIGLVGLAVTSTFTAGAMIYEGF